MTLAMLDYIWGVYDHFMDVMPRRLPRRRIWN
jgi:hypothetical protein